MLKTISGIGWALFDDERQLISHSPDKPFVTAVRQEKSYTSSRGSVKATVSEAERIALTDLAESENGVVFSAGRHALEVEYSQISKGAELKLSGETGWSYEFRLPAIENEAVFGGGEFRLLNIIFFAFVLLVIINIFYWLGWAAKKFKKTDCDKKGIVLLPLAACAALSLAIVGVSIACGGSLTSVSALGILRNGEAKAFHDCALERLSILRDPDVHNAELEDYPSHPYLLYYDDITADPTDWKNVDMASFYGKDSVVLK